MAERRIAIPRVGVVEALPSFRVIASMNPYDNVGTTRLSTSVHDRLCRLAIGYQDAEAERGIVGRRTGVESPRLIADAVALTGATREREDLRQGSSVRGAIDTALVAAQLAAMRGVPLPEEPAVAPRAACRRSTPTSSWTPSCWRCPDGSSRRDAREPDPGDRAARDLGGPLPPRAGRGRAWLKGRRGRLPADPQRPGRDGPRCPARSAAGPSSSPSSRRSTSPPAAVAGWPLSSGDRRRTGPAATRAGGTASGTTDEPADLARPADLATESSVDQLTRQRARQIAQRLSVPRPPRDRRPRRAGGRARSSTPWSGGSDELDLDRTLEAVAGVALSGGDRRRRPRAGPAAALGGPGRRRVRAR